MSIFDDALDLLQQLQSARPEYVTVEEAVEQLGDPSLIFTEMQDTVQGKSGSPGKYKDYKLEKELKRLQEKEEISIEQREVPLAVSVSRAGVYEALLSEPIWGLPLPSPRKEFGMGDYYCIKYDKDDEKFRTLQRSDFNYGAARKAITDTQREWQRGWSKHIDKETGEVSFIRNHHVSIQSILSQVAADRGLQESSVGEGWLYDDGRLMIGEPTPPRIESERLGKKFMAFLEEDKRTVRRMAKEDAENQALQDEITQGTKHVLRIPAKYAELLLGEELGVNNLGFGGFTRSTPE